jgi:hypothetical protein
MNSPLGLPVNLRGKCSVGYTHTNESVNEIYNGTVAL